MPFFDHNATTPMLPAAREAWLQAAGDAWQNPASPYRAGARVHRLLEETRARVAAFFQGEERDEIVFTSGATEAANAVLAWVGRHRTDGAEILVSPTEHPCVTEPARAWFAARTRWLGVNRAGLVDPGEIEERLRGGRVALVAAMAANNETGVLAPVGAVAALCERYGVPYLCDASQWIGRLPAAELPGTAFLIGCAHKFGGPKGTGLLRVPAAMGGSFAGALGGGQEKHRRAGTEDFPGIAAMAAALAFAEAQGEEVRARRTVWRDAFIADVGRSIAGAVVNGAEAPRLWNTVSLRLPRHLNTRWTMRLDRLGFEVSTGSACATGAQAPSHVLAAMGLAADEARRTIRLSGGWETTAGEWRDLAAALAEAWGFFEQEARSGADGTGVIVLP